jgi:hypothetical protein
MKVAFCLSGQTRTWEKCYPTWKNFEKKLCNLLGISHVDYFCHAWDFNTPPHAVLAATGGPSKDIVDDYLTVKGTVISNNEQEKFLKTINPINYIFETEQTSKDRIKETFTRSNIHKDHHGITSLDWIASQFYSVMYSSHLKKKYELENNFSYDIVFRLRCDLFLDDHQINWFFNEDSNNFNIPTHNSLYSCHTNKDNSQFPFHRFGDIFWYADSTTFDRICNFYRWLPIIGSKSFNTNKVGTEHALYFYAKMLRMTIVPISIDPKIYRQHDYIDRKKQAGLNEELGGHELI